MSNAKLLTALTLVAVVGFAAHWYLQNQSYHAVSPTMSPNNSSATLDQDDGDAPRGNQGTAVAPAANTEAAADSSLESDLSALDSLFEEDYDDSDLDSTFSAEGANTLTADYDY